MQHTREHGEGCVRTKVRVGQWQCWDGVCGWFDRGGALLAPNRHAGTCGTVSRQSRALCLPIWPCRLREPAGHLLALNRAFLYGQTQRQY
jgi:hypothetical protein